MCLVCIQLDRDNITFKKAGEILAQIKEVIDEEHYKEVSERIAAPVKTDHFNPLTANDSNFGGGFESFPVKDLKYDPLAVDEDVWIPTTHRNWYYPDSED